MISAKYVLEGFWYSHIHPTNLDGILANPLNSCAFFVIQDTAFTAMNEAYYRSKMMAENDSLEFQGKALVLLWMYEKG